MESEDKTRNAPLRSAAFLITAQAGGLSLRSDEFDKSISLKRREDRHFKQEGNAGTYQRIEIDIEVMHEVARFASKYTPCGKRYAISQIVREEAPG